MVLTLRERLHKSDVRSQPRQGPKLGRKRMRRGFSGAPSGAGCVAAAASRRCKTPLSRCRIPPVPSARTCCSRCCRCSGMAPRACCPSPPLTSRRSCSRSAPPPRRDRSWPVSGSSCRIRISSRRCRVYFQTGAQKYEYFENNSPLIFLAWDYVFSLSGS